MQGQQGLRSPRSSTEVKNTDIRSQVRTGENRRRDGRQFSGGEVPCGMSAAVRQETTNGQEERGVSRRRHRGLLRRFKENREQGCTPGATRSRKVFCPDQGAGVGGENRNGEQNKIENWEEGREGGGDDDDYYFFTHPEILFSKNLI